MAHATSHEAHGHGTATAHAHGHGGGHTVPLVGLFLALLALTAAEVGLFEFWHASAADGDPIFPKYVMVILLLVMTLPKAAIVMIYFMHLKFEKPFVVLLAVVPLLMVFIAVLPSLIDSLTLKKHGLTLNKVENLDQYSTFSENGHGAGTGDAAHSSAAGGEVKHRDSTDTGDAEE